MRTEFQFTLIIAIINFFPVISSVSNLYMTHCSTGFFERKHISMYSYTHTHTHTHQRTQIKIKNGRNFIEIAIVSKPRG